MTAYVDIDPANPDNQRTQPAWQISLKNEIKRLHNTNGAAVLEHEGVVKALGRAQVKTVVLPYPMDSDEFDALIVDAVINRRGRRVCLWSRDGRIRPAEERVGWILFLLDEMKAFLTPEEYADLLDELQNEIDALRS